MQNELVAALAKVGVMVNEDMDGLCLGFSEVQKSGVLDEV